MVPAAFWVSHSCVISIVARTPGQPTCAFSKRIHFTEHMSLELLAEGFNIFNKSNVTGVNTSYISSINFGTTAQTGVLNYNPAYGSTTSINNTIIFSPRQIQLGARFHF